MTNVMKFVVLPVVAVALMLAAIAASGGELIDRAARGERIDITRNATHMGGDESKNPASRLATLLRTNANVVGTISGSEDNVAIIVKKQPEGEELTDICTKANTVGFEIVFAIVQGSPGHNLGDDICP